MKIKLAKAIFHDKKGNIAVQERGVASKRSEKYGFWGGGIEKGETPRQAVLRELKEELNFVPQKITYWKKVSLHFPSKDKGEKLDVDVYVFLSPITDELLDTQVLEGAGIVIMQADYASQHSESLFSCVQILDGLKEYLQKNE